MVETIAWFTHEKTNLKTKRYQLPFLKQAGEAFIQNLVSFFVIGLPWLMDR
jgi:hypothetical protein